MTRNIGQKEEGQEKKGKEGKKQEGDEAGQMGADSWQVGKGQE